MKKNSNLFSIYIVLLFIFFIFLALFLFFQNRLLPADPSNQQKITFIISKGEGIFEFSEQLKLQGLIKDELCFKIHVYFLGISKKIQAGTFYLSPAMTATEIAESLTKGSNDKKITIVEGLRQEQVGLLLLQNGLSVDLAEWSKAVKGSALEGKLFPDTYFFPAGADISAILKIFNNNFEKKVVVGLKEEIVKSRLSLDDILILASMVEREVRTEEDRRIVAGILLKRLQNDWLLQVDATVQYAISNSKFKMQNSKFSDWWTKNLSASDLKIKSPYNTYLNKGLPPTPICNPGLSAIKAVLSPQDSPYWFYLTGNDGATHYAKTAEEHAENIRKYLR